MSRPWGHGRGGAVGTSRRRPHPRLRRPRGVARGPHVEERGDGTVTRRVAHGRVDRHPRERGHRRDRRSSRRVAPDRDRRDLLQTRPPLPDRGRRSRPRPARVGRTGPQRHRPGRVLRRARPRTLRAAHPRFGRYGRLDRPRRRPTGPERGARAPIRSTSSRGRSTRSISNAAAPGTKPKAGAPPAVSASPAKAARPATRNTSPNRVTRSGRTPATSPAVNATSSTGSPRPTRGCGAPTSSKKDCVTRSQSKAKKANSARPMEPTGRADPGSPRSCNSNAGSPCTAKRSTSRSTPASPKDSSNPRTPRSDSSPASRSGSTDTNHSSRSRCSPSDHTHPASPAATDPRKQQESQIWRAWRGCFGPQAADRAGVARTKARQVRKRSAD